MFRMAPLVVRVVGAWQRWGVVLLALAVALPASIFAKGGEGGPIPERDTTCWGCHVSWAPPLRTFYEIVPPAEAGAAPGQEFDFVVQLANIWTPPGDGPYIRFLEPTLDLSRAPSLTFGGGPDPIEGVEVPGVANVDPFGLTSSPVARGSVQLPVPVGMTVLEVDLRPGSNSAAPPTLTLVLRDPGGAEVLRQRAPAPGQPVQVVVEQPGAGNWTADVQVDNLPDLGAPSAQGVPFVVTYSARADTSGEVALAQPQSLNLPKGQSFLFTFGLRAVSAPQPGEEVGLVVNATVYYNTTKPYDQPLRVQTAADGRTIIVGPSEPPGAPAPFNGFTLDTLSEAIGYAAAFLLIASIWTGGMFGKASRRQLNTVFGSAKRRVAFHNFLSYGILLVATVHTVLFIVETAYHWTLGLIWGGLAILAMFGLGLTGAFQVGMIRRWNYAFWRWSHYGLAVAAILFTLVHMVLDGVHFGFVQEFLGWDDPLDPRDVT
jgi:hypothetical protein